MFLFDNSVSNWVRHKIDESVSTLRKVADHPVARKVAAAALSLGCAYAIEKAFYMMADPVIVPANCEVLDRRSFYRPIVLSDEKINFSPLRENTCDGFPPTLCFPTPLLAASLDSIRTSFARGVAIVVPVCLGAPKLFKRAINKVGSVLGPYLNAIVPSRKKSMGESTWLQAGRGAMLLPVALTVGYASVVAAAMAGFRTLDPLTEFKRNPCVSFHHQRDIYEFGSISVPREEFICRVMIQEFTLKQMPSLYLIAHRLPKEARFVSEATLAKVGRVVLSSALFSLFHLKNAQVFGNGVPFQLANTFGTGLVFGALQERTGRVWASIGLHAMANFFVTYSIMNRNC